MSVPLAQTLGNRLSPPLAVHALDRGTAHVPMSVPLSQTLLVANEDDSYVFDVLVFVEFSLLNFEAFFAS